MFPEPLHSNQMRRPAFWWGQTRGWYTWPPPSTPLRYIPGHHPVLLPGIPSHHPVLLPGIYLAVATTQYSSQEYTCPPPSTPPRYTWPPPRPVYSSQVYLATTQYSSQVYLATTQYSSQVYLATTQYSSQVYLAATQCSSQVYTRPLPSTPPRYTWPPPSISLTKMNVNNSVCAQFLMSYPAHSTPVNNHIMSSY